MRISDWSSDVCSSDLDCSSRPLRRPRFTSGCTKRYTSPPSRWRLPSLRVLSGKAVCAILVTCGFAEARRRGSHIVMQRHEGESTVTVPVPAHTEVRVGTLLSDRQSVVEGKWVVVRVDRGGRSIIKKKIN